ncbi:hypothetical protein C440_08082 [Haloferax mucosum ATCC BAA-1512]|uniref:Uncharacterized protein n=1 Tax=Haloferax mucosum ATCC BAA-1512 TaxID=662479 RepID=M0IHV8_9EURY|nr:hypothetical protein [Haloferax mucosum]ELZ95019.1 hypothetical protein C440_08082 [Haloferax mucosum ATCC BAA-1512]
MSQKPIGTTKSEFSEALKYEFTRLLGGTTIRNTSGASELVAGILLYPHTVLSAITRITLLVGLVTAFSPLGRLYRVTSDLLLFVVVSLTLVGLAPVSASQVLPTAIATPLDAVGESLADILIALMNLII